MKTHLANVILFKISIEKYFTALKCKYLHILFLVRNFHGKKALKRNKQQKASKKFIRQLFNSSYLKRHLIRTFFESP